MEEDDELVFSIDADGYLDVVICSEEAFDEWVDSDSEVDEDDSEEEEDNEDEDTQHPLPESDWSRTDVLNGGEYTFLAPEAGNYVLLLVNWNDEPVEVTVDAAVWQAQK